MPVRLRVSLHQRTVAAGPRWWGCVRGAQFGTEDVCLCLSSRHMVLSKETTRSPRRSPWALPVALRDVPTDWLASLEATAHKTTRSSPVPPITQAYHRASHWHEPRRLMGLSHDVGRRQGVGVAWLCATG